MSTTHAPARTGGGTAPIGIPRFAGSVADAYAEAIEASEPRWVPASYYTDDRGWSLMNLLQGVMGPEGQVNFSVQYPGVIKAWHRHKLQTDFWLCLQGHLRIGVACRDRGVSWTVVSGEKNPGIAIIPPTLWHGASTVGHVPAGLLYYVTKAFDPKNPDEERLAFDAIERFPWGIEHR